MNPTASPALVPRREQTPDLLKGIAVVFMVLVHIIEEMSTHEVFASLPGRVALFLGGAPAAPVFMAVMGYFLQRSARPLRDHVVRGASLFAGGLVLNVGLNLHLLIAIGQGRFDFDPWKYILGADILPLAGLSIIVLALARPLFRGSVAMYTALLAVSVILGELLRPVTADENSLLAYCGAFLWGDHWWSYFPLFPWLAYPTAGYLFAILRARATHRLSTLRKMGPPLVILYAAVIVFSLDYAGRVTSDLPSYYHHDILFAGWILMFLAGWTLTVSMLSRPVSRTVVGAYLAWLGRNVTAVYVFQWLLIGNIATAIYQTQGLPASIGWFVAMLTGASLLTLLWRKSRNRTVTAPVSYS